MKQPITDFPHERQTFNSPVMKTSCHSTLALTFFVAIAATNLPANPTAQRGARTEQPGRGELGAQLDRNLAAGQRTLALARHQAKELRGEARERFEAAAADVQAAERRLRKNLEDVKDASVDEWQDARLTLATAYEAYARAIAEVQRIASATTKSEDRGIYFSRQRRASAERDRP